MGGTDDLVNAEGRFDNGTVYFSFTRAVDTGDRFDNAIRTTSMWLLYAYGTLVNGVPQYHQQQKAPIQITFNPKEDF